ncbi:toxin co-regulated pilus biosynthesis Q family protein [Klebsiella aerogenes]|uniref:toxin co-regulated pilus biosynthesis Q family protein n=1 Tax=Klebsiella aerogenes TaxID=548 RepID=UPI000667A8ED|nr:toxin co-regulated pilus biosynthesis Q family protein [Klebsiella aerogenes]
MKKTWLLPLPLLLSGCQHLHSDTPESTKSAQQTVDQLLQDSIVRIGKEQDTLAQACGVHFDPMVPVAPSPASAPRTTASASVVPSGKAGPSLPLPSPPASIVTMANITSTGTPPASLPALVTRDGHNQPLATALKAIIPADWTSVLSQRAKAFHTRVSWRGGDQWPHVLDHLAGDYPLHIVIMWASRQVTVDLREAKPQAAPVKATPAVTSGPHNPFSGSAASPATAKVTTAPSPAATVKPAPVPAPLPVQETWRAEAGQTLKDVLFTWSAKADCGNGRHWTVDWATKTNYHIDAPLTFTGSYRDALNGIFYLYQGASVPLYAGTATPQCLLRVDDKPVR